ncbi:MAG: BLUF domain-containing protein, partial [Halieaceae bacterium]|nr:BLUF domain-containing protein [Halieaceae bacterium]
MVEKPRAATAQSQADPPPEHGGALYCISYVSTQTQHMDNDELLALLEIAREKNQSLGITGILLHREDSFFQILEGGEDEVCELYETIAADPRHDRIEIVTEGPV